jgi:hypothetical protein
MGSNPAQWDSDGVFGPGTDVPKSLRRAARGRMRDTRAGTWQGRRDSARRVVVGWRGSTLPWVALAECAAALIWLFWPQSLTPDVLLHAESARSFVQALWQVLAVALALSAAIVTFSFATFTSSRLSELGSSLPDFARSSGLLVGITIGLVALIVCGASLLALPAGSGTTDSAIGRADSAGAVAATALGLLALVLVPYVLRLALRAGDRGWVQLQLLHRIQRALDRAVAGYVERLHARGVLAEVINRHGLETAALSGPTGYHAFRHPRSGVVLDIRLRLLVRLASDGDSPNAVRLNPMLAALALGFELGPSTPGLWVRDGTEISKRDAKRVFRTRSGPDQPSTADDLDRLNRQGLLAVRDDDEVWYREVAGIYRAVLLHLINAWARFGAAPGRAPGQDEVGLQRLSEDLEAHVREIMDLHREEMARLAIDVPLSVGLSALEQGENGAGLSLGMLSLLGRMTIDATRRGTDSTATTARSYAASAVFMLLRAGAEDL